MISVPGPDGRNPGPTPCDWPCASKGWTKHETVFHDRQAAKISVSQQTIIAASTTASSKAYGCPAPASGASPARPCTSS